MILDDEDGFPVYADTAGAVELLVSAGVTTDRIRDWRRRGMITPLNPDDRGRKLYRMSEVYAAERRTRQARSRPRKTGHLTSA